jgi:hypothetical protein
MEAEIDRVAALMHTKFLEWLKAHPEVEKKWNEQPDPKNPNTKPWEKQGTANLAAYRAVARAVLEDLGCLPTIVGG